MARPQIFGDISSVAIYHPVLAIRAVAECAEFVLPIFEKRFPRDNRPRDAIMLTQAWARGFATLGEVRSAYEGMSDWITWRAGPATGQDMLPYYAGMAAREACGLVRFEEHNHGGDAFYVPQGARMAIAALGGKSRDLTIHLHHTWIPPVILQPNHRWKTIYGTGSTKLEAPAIPYKQEWPLLLKHPDFQKGFTGGRQYTDRELVFTLAEAWKSEYFTPEMFVAIDAALEGRTA